MKYILVLYMCMSGACDSVYEQIPYDTIEDCETASQQVRDTAQEMFPLSSGQVWCLTQDEFNKYITYYGQTKGI